MENTYITIMVDITILINKLKFYYLKRAELIDIQSFFWYNVIVSEEYSGALVEIYLRKGGIAYDTSRWTTN